MRIADGSWLNFVNSIPGPSGLWSVGAVALTLGGIALVLVASTWALRQLTGPYGVLASAANRFGLDLHSPMLSERGPKEVRAAVRAFNLMQARLKRMVEDRDQMVAAVSHDLRTPVTRLRLRAELVKDPEQKRRILADLEEIETMTQSVLAFASDSAVAEERQLLDLVSLLESVCGDTPGATLDLAADLPSRVPYRAEPVALRRCIANLVDNAVKYGERAVVSLRVERDAVRILVDDEGPGIAAANFDKVFRPFVRLEVSRNRETGGTGARADHRALGRAKPRRRCDPGQPARGRAARRNHPADHRRRPVSARFGVAACSAPRELHPNTSPDHLALARWVAGVAPKSGSISALTPEPRSAASPATRPRAGARR